MSEKGKDNTGTDVEPSSPKGKEDNSIVRYLVSSYEKYNILSLLIAIVAIVTILIIAADECRQCFNKSLKDTRHRKIFWAYGKNIESGYLKEVFTILDRFGYKNDPNATDWDLLWAHDYPFRKLYPQLNNLKPQEYVDKPLLVNGHKFDIGIYTVITSVDPLRIYIYNGEALLRFCPVKYYPFDPKNLDKYVVGDDYLPIWEVPALDYYYNKLGFGMRDSLNTYLLKQGRDPMTIWSQVEDSIRTVILAKEPLIVDILKRFKSKRNFFEMMRFDFVVDENLKVYLLEANMSPNLSSAHFPPNRLLYQQVLYNVLGLIGIGERIYKDSLGFRSKSEREMIVSDKNIATFPEKCNSDLCRLSCVPLDCQLCKPCLSPETKRYLEEAFMEYLHRGDCKRIFPPPMSRKEAFEDIDLDTYSAENQLQYRWFQGKCQLEVSWC